MQKAPNYLLIAFSVLWHLRNYFSYCQYVMDTELQDQQNYKINKLHNYNV